MHTGSNNLFPFFIFTFLISLSSLAGITQGKIDILLSAKEISMVPQKGFHLNDKAPASAVFDDSKMKVQPTTKTEQKFAFEIPVGSKKAQLKFFVCDDKKTVCEQQTHEMALKTNMKVGSERESVKVASTSAATTTDESSKYLALAQTANLKSDKPTLLVFSAPWCPACIRLKSETLNQASVKKVLKNVNTVYLNIDLVEHEAISKKFNVKAIPTMILLSKEGNEVSRWLDFQLSSAFATDLTASLKITADLEETKKLADVGDQTAIRRLAENSFNQMDWKEAAKWYSLSSNPDDLQKKLYAEISYTKEEKADDKTKIEEYLKTLLKATTLSQAKLDKLSWTIDYYEQVAEDETKPLDENSKKNILESIAELNKLVEAPKRLTAELKKSMMTGLYGFEAMEVLDIMARGYDLLKDETGKKQTQERIFKLAAAKKIDLNQPGVVIHISYYMNQAGHIAEVETLSKKLIAKYPKTYVYYNRYASFLLKNKRYDEALSQINTALTYKEGNEPQLNVVKARILAALKKKDEAMTLVDQTLAMIEPFPEKYKRTKKTLTGIKADLVKPEEAKN